MANVIYGVGVPDTSDLESQAKRRAPRPRKRLPDGVIPLTVIVTFIVLTMTPVGVNLIGEQTLFSITDPKGAKACRLLATWLDGKDVDRHTGNPKGLIIVSGAVSD